MDWCANRIRAYCVVMMDNIIVPPIYPRAIHLIFNNVTFQLETEGLAWIKHKMNTLKYESVLEGDLP